MVNDWIWGLTGNGGHRKRAEEDTGTERHRQSVQEEAEDRQRQRLENYMAAVGLLCQES